MTRGGTVALALALSVAAPAPLGAQVVTTQPPVTEPPATQPPVTEPPVTEPPVATAPPTTRPRSSTTRPATTVPASTTTTAVRLLPPPSVSPQDPSAAPVGTAQSDHISSMFVWLSVLGFLVAIALITSQWFLTRPGRRGWTI